MHELDALKIVVSFVITGSVGLIPPIIMRFMILNRPIGKLSAVGTCIVFWIIISFILSAAMGSKSITDVALTLITFVSYRILRKGAATTKSMVATNSRKILSVERTIPASPAVFSQGAGKYDRAGVAATKALEVAEKNVGPVHPDVAVSLENLAALYRATHRDKDAAKLEQRAADIWAVKQGS